MLTIDAMIWLYYFDPNAPENPPVTKWLTLAPAEGKSIIAQDFSVSIVIVLEVTHHLFKNPQFRCRIAT